MRRVFIPIDQCIMAKWPLFDLKIHYLCWWCNNRNLYTLNKHYATHSKCDYSCKTQLYALKKPQYNSRYMCSYVCGLRTVAWDDGVHLMYLSLICSSSYYIGPSCIFILFKLATYLWIPKLKHEICQLQMNELPYFFRQHDRLCQGNQTAGLK